MSIPCLVFYQATNFTVSHILHPWMFLIYFPSKQLPVLIVSIPVPLQYEHLTALVPGSERDPRHFGHISTTFTWISLLTPTAAWVNVRFIITCNINCRNIKVDQVSIIPQVTRNFWHCRKGTHFAFNVSSLKDWMNFRFMVPCITY